jgi:hypothetical protein
MSYIFAIRNRGAGVLGRFGMSGGATEEWRKIPFGVDEDGFSVSRRLRYLRALCSLLVLQRSTVEYGGGCRWIYGALGSKGRQEGGQYRAGRRAPPLPHRSV